MYLTKDEIFPLYKSGELIIRPLLSEKQFGEMTLDLRLGTDFLVSFQGREPYIDATGDEEARPIGSFFQETKRLIGETFFLHPHQTVLCSTLEYIKLPNDIFVTISTRSSFSRLGLLISSIVQPGYCGCLSLELTNHNNNAIKIRVGSAVLQALQREPTVQGGKQGESNGNQSWRNNEGDPRHRRLSHRKDRETK
jgi:dCTP deaminase